MPTDKTAAGPFHTREGWWFKREPNGYVRIIVDAAPQRDQPHEINLLLDDATWASVLAHVCWRGADGETFREAEQFHMGLDAIPDLKEQDQIG